MSELVRTLQLGSYGQDVDGAKRTVYRGLDSMDGGKRLKAHADNRVSVRRTFGAFFRSDVKALEAKNAMTVDGKITPTQMSAWVKCGYPDALALDLMQQYADDHKPQPLPPKFVEPNQGFGSLVPDLWPLYAQGRNAGLTDVGTYNPRSVLPSGSPSDHATSRLSGRIGEPACAFDLGFNSSTREAARVFFTAMTVSPRVHYVIMENRIWSREKGLHAYTHGGHETHVHTSGHRR